MIKKILSLLLVGVFLLSALVGCTPSLDDLKETFEEEGYTVKYNVNYKEIADVYEQAGEEFEEGAIYRVLFVTDPESTMPRWLKIVEFYKKSDADLFFRLHEREYSNPKAGTTIKQKGKVIFYGTPSVYAVVD